jgi:hypothetical protein
VSLACTASDAGSGLANPADASFALSTSVAAGLETAGAVTGSHQVCDKAGNCSTGGPIAGNKIDRKPPVIAIIAPSGNGTLVHPAVLHSLLPSVSFSATDAGSGVAHWQLSRWSASVTALGTCGTTWSLDRTVTDSTGGSSLSDAETLQNARCYYWTLNANDAVLNSSPTITSEVIVATP